MVPTPRAGRGPEPASAMPETSILPPLERVIADRRARPPERSYVARLLAGGVAAIGAKVTEEAAEVVAAAEEPDGDGRDHLVHEAADLLFHTLVLLAHRGVAWADVEAEL